MKGNVLFEDHIFWRKRSYSGIENRGESYLDRYWLTVNTENRASDIILPWPCFSLLKRENKLFNLANISERQILCQVPGILNQTKFDIEPKRSSEPCCLAGSVQNFLSWYTEPFMLWSPTDFAAPSATITKIAITEFHCFTSLSALIRSSLLQLFLVVKSNGILLPLISCLIISYHLLPDISILHFFSGSFPLGNKYAHLFTYT